MSEIINKDIEDGAIPREVPSIGLDQYLLVSESNELDQQFDSQKMSVDELVQMAQDHLFKNHLKIMSDYLTNNQYSNLSTKVKGELSTQQKRWNETKDQSWYGKFKVVDGQIIIVDSNSVDQALNEGETLIDYIKRYWDIPVDFEIYQISKCIPRGMTVVSNPNTIQLHNSMNQILVEENFPRHMHHSGVTTGSGITTMQSKTQTKNLGSSDGLAYDIFQNDSLSTGLSDNEMDGVVDKFTPQDFGLETITHQNLPNCHSFYAFLVKSRGI